MTAALIHQRRWKTLRVLALSLVIIGLDNTILNVALPSLQEHFDASSSTLQWMVDSYLVSFAGLLLTMGMLGDRFGRKRALQTGIALFGLSSLAVLFVETSTQLIAVRAAHGRRWSADHAGDAVDHHQRLPARGARQGDRRVGRHGRDRRRPRPALRRPAARVLRLVLGLPRQRARGARRLRRRHPLRARVARPQPGPLRRPRRAAVDRRPRGADLRGHRGARARLGGPGHPRRVRRRAGARRRVRGLGAAHAPRRCST